MVGWVGVTEWMAPMTSTGDFDGTDSFDGFDGGFDGSDDSLVGFDGFDGGFVGVAETDDRAKNRWKTR